MRNTVHSWNQQLAATMNLASMNDDWKESEDRRATHILVAFVNRYVYVQMHQKDGKVLSVRVLGEKFDLKESTLGKLLNVRRYLSGWEAMFFKRRHESVEEEEGKEQKEMKGDSKSTVSAAEVLDHDKM